MILSVSRRTDIPNYYSDWFFNRIKEGYLYVRNPRNAHQVSRVDLSPETIDCIVFWTKNPAGMLKRLEELKEYQYYFQFTLTGYGKDIEPGLPDKRELTAVFKNLSAKTGKERVIWRYDPILINDRYTMEYHVNMFEELAENLSGYTEKVIISFVDSYVKTQKNMEQLNIHTMSEKEMTMLAERLAHIAKRNQLKTETCAELIDLQSVGIGHSCCIDKKLIERLSGCRLIVEKDRNQREACGCFESIETGTYNTCLNGCKYCYANFNEEMVKENISRHDVNSPILCSRLKPDDVVTERKMKSLKDMQMHLSDIK